MIGQQQEIRIRGVEAILGGAGLREHAREATARDAAVADLMRIAVELERGSVRGPLELHRDRVVLRDIGVECDRELERAIRGGVERLQLREPGHRGVRRTVRADVR
ncbi:MAG: hypothetical protein H0T79_08105 [Deltaproteobacteria bacterium]|nr:hypothetical protein [Deltaproteobacteria bacterium]